MQLLSKTLWQFLQRLNTEFPQDPEILLLDRHPKNWSRCSNRAIPVFTASNVLDNSPKWRQCTLPPGDEQGTECGLTHTMEGHSATETEAVLTDTTQVHLENRRLGARSRSRRPCVVRLLLQKHPGAGDAHACSSGAGGQEDFTGHRASLWDDEAVPIRCSDRNYTMLCTHQMSQMVSLTYVYFTTLKKKK